MDFEFKEKYGIDDLCEIMKILRSENGCPWDREQTHGSIRKDFLEEVYEAVEAIDADSPEMMREELGDVLLQVVFHSRIEEERGSFDFNDVVNDICTKLIVRHPHVFGDTVVSDTEDVLRNWNDIKQKTKGQKSYTETLESVCKALPALMRAQKVIQRAKRAGVDTGSAGSAVCSIEDDIAALKESAENGRTADAADRIGSLLFDTVRLCLIGGADAEECLTRATDSFIERFKASENNLRSKGNDTVSE